jgi:hypothetical protein
LAIYGAYGKDAKDGFKQLKEHIGHEIEVAGYQNGRTKIVDVTVECVDCDEILFDYDLEGDF